MIGEGVVCIHCYMLQRNGILPPQSPREGFHIGTVLIIGFDE
jgi:hypothetical protein